MDNFSFKHQNFEILLLNNNGEQMGEITYQDNGNGIWSITHTGVSPTLRGQGLAEQLLDKLVKLANEKQVKLKAVCPYVIRQFEEQPEKYDHINAEK